MDPILVVRLVIALTFLLIVAGIPYTLLKLRNFIKFYMVRHAELELRVAAIERQMHELPVQNTKSGPLS